MDRRASGEDRVGALKTLDELKQRVTREHLLNAKQHGFSDRQLAHLWKTDEWTVRELRKALDVIPVYKTVDTCAAEFEAYTPYHYSTYETENEARRTDREKIMILGGGPNRIGQGIEFDYCCCHASFALREDGFETIMVNSNPETVSTDYDTSDKLYFEPLTTEDVLSIADLEQPDGVIVQFGGQTPLNLARSLEKGGLKIVGTSPDSIDLAEDRKQFGALIEDLGIRQPENGTAVSVDEAVQIADTIGFPVLVRPSYVLGGRAMAIVYDTDALVSYVENAIDASPEAPILIDRYLQNAHEFDVDAVADETAVVIGGVMQHIESAGVHSGDSACVLPPYDITEENLQQLKNHTHKLARALGVVGLMNVQYAIQDGQVYIIEVNPRASRTVPFVSKTIGVPLAKVAARTMVGNTLENQGFTSEVSFDHIAVKEAVLPFNKFPGVDAILGPEMKSTGEVMGIDTDFGLSFQKAQLGAGVRLPVEGTVFISVNDRDKDGVVDPAKRLNEAGFRIVATQGTQQFLESKGIPAERILKIREGRPHILDEIKNEAIALMINTPAGEKTRSDDYQIRQAAVQYGVPYTTTLSAARAAVSGIESLKKDQTVRIRSLQEFHTA
ncbi:MAG: carbamoyl-phosphate synthase large subunit [Gemmatimonadetes bacterium]|nr:carbamoyl-phosphate synthase large subunit [Gemmatimonadota bacterium]